MNLLGTFPFGEPVQKLAQIDRSPKRVFVLGVYASAVHARWTSADGRQVVTALAVASEPHIFWRGEGAGKILDRIKLPPEAGRLSPADEKFNGPSGQAFDTHILEPLGFKREHAWLCDLVPYSCMNPSQEAAIDKHYKPAMAAWGLPPTTTPRLPTPLIDAARQNDILGEILESKADTLVLLGDLPIKWFLNRPRQEPEQALGLRH